MVVEAMWRNFKRLVLYLYNRPRVDFATYALVTQALPPYRIKLNRILDDPRKGRASFLNGEQGPIKKAWLTLHKREIKGTRISSASTLSKNSLALMPIGGPPSSDATSHPSMTYAHSFHLRIEPGRQNLRYWGTIHGSQGCKVGTMAPILLLSQLPCMLDSVPDCVYSDHLLDSLHPPGHSTLVLMVSFDRAV